MQQEQQQAFVFSSLTVCQRSQGLPCNTGNAQSVELGSTLSSTTGFLGLVRNLPSLCFPAARTLFQIYLNFTKFWKPLGAEPWLQGKSAIKAPRLELVPASKAQVLVCFISIPMCRHPQMLKSCRDSLLLLPGPAERGCLPARPSGNIPVPLCSGVLLQLEASEGFPTPGIRRWLSDVMGTWGKAKQFYVGSVATGKLGVWSVLCPRCDESLVCWRK